MGSGQYLTQVNVRASSTVAERVGEALGVALPTDPNTVVTRGEDMTTVSDFEVGAGETIPFVLTYGPSHLPVPAPIDAGKALRETEDFWAEWSGRSDPRATTVAGHSSPSSTTKPIWHSIYFHVNQYGRAAVDWRR